MVVRERRTDAGWEFKMITPRPPTAGGLAGMFFPALGPFSWIIHWRSWPLSMCKGRHIHTSEGLGITNQHFRAGHGGPAGCMRVQFQQSIPLFYKLCCKWTRVIIWEWWLFHCSIELDWPGLASRSPETLQHQQFCPHWPLYWGSL